MLESYKAYLLEGEKSELTVEKYLRDVTKFLMWLGKEEITKVKVLEFKAGLVENYAGSSANSMISSLNSYLAFVGRSDCRVKAIKQQRRVFLSEERELTREEYRRLISAAERKPRLSLLMQTICSTGIRVSEHRFITVESARCGQAEVRMKGKHRIVFLEKKLCKVLLKYAKEQKILSGSIFVTASGKPLDRCNIWAEMKKLCDTAGVSRDTEGVSEITNEDFLVSKLDGSGSYECSSNVATVVLTTDCLVKFETNGGSEIEPVVAIYGELLERPEDPVREGMHLEGWYCFFTACESVSKFVGNFLLKSENRNGKIWILISEKCCL